jgi:hypothetical protein
MSVPMSDNLEYMCKDNAAVIERLWRAHTEVERMRAQMEQARREMESNHQRVESIIADPYGDDDGIGTGLYWETYFGPDKAQSDLATAISEREPTLDDHLLDRANAAGALLQYAKQAISHLHGRSRDNAPVGRRKVAGLPLRDVIWEGRNQALHREDRQFSASVDTVFLTLEATYPGKFADYTTGVNKAFDVVTVLNWRSLDAFEADLLSIA